MAIIKYQEAAGLEVKRGRPPAGPAPSRADLVKLLIAKRADVNAKDKDGWTPLHWAAWGGHGDVAELLIKNLADVNAKNFKGQTPLDLAVERDHKEVAEVLKKHEAVE
jgi:ankyrin repeat protein